MIEKPKIDFSKRYFVRRLPLTPTPGFFIIDASKNRKAIESFVLNHKSYASVATFHYIGSTSEHCEFQFIAEEDKKAIQFRSLKQ